MLSFNSLISSVKPSPTFAASQKAARLRAQGRQILSLTLGEPDFDTPQHIKDGAIEAMRSGFTKYTATEGIPLLRQRIAEKLKRDQQLEYSPSQVLVTNGGKQAIGSALSVLLSPGDEVVIPAPYWTSYPDMVYLAGGKPVIVSAKPSEGYLVRPSELIRACSPRTKVIILNSPSNPTGAAYSAAELEAFADAVSSLKNSSSLVVLCDEIYEYFVYDGFKHVSLATVAPALRENILIVNGFSKAYAMTGWRVGYAAGPQPLIDAMATHQSQFTSNVCSIAQYAAAAAYEDRGAFPREMISEFSKRLDMICNVIDRLGGALSLAARPRGSFYAFLRIEGILGKRDGEYLINSADDFCNYLLEKHDLAVVTGEAFGDDKAIRLSFAVATDVLSRALERLERAALALK